MVEAIAVIIVIQLTCVTAIIANRLMHCMKNNNWCNKVYPE
jgi:hypothetical protein